MDLLCFVVAGTDNISSDSEYIKFTGCNFRILHHPHICSSDLTVHALYRMCKVPSSGSSVEIGCQFERLKFTADRHIQTTVLFHFQEGS